MTVKADTSSAKKGAAKNASKFPGTGRSLSGKEETNDDNEYGSEVNDGEESDGEGEGEYEEDAGEDASDFGEEYQSGSGEEEEEDDYSNDEADEDEESAERGGSRVYNMRPNQKRSRDDSGASSDDE
ncbi:hypothetical protein IW150_006291, partial [Coemansia sp. RSA 2607]